jgi:Sel1 repeat-containing protein
MKRRWVAVCIACIALISAGIVVRTLRSNRRLAKWAAVYRVRAERGDAKSQYALGAMYYYGKGLPQDYAEAVRWYRKSAEQGDANAQYSLSYMYHEGKGLPQDDSEAILWCRKAAEQNNALAQDALGFIYWRGEGVAPDYSEAVSWYRKSAEQGYPGAQHDLATCITSAMVYRGIEFMPTTCFSKLQPKGTRMLSGRFSVTGRELQSTQVRVLEAFDKSYILLTYMLS